MTRPQVFLGVIGILGVVAAGLLATTLGVGAPAPGRLLTFEDRSSGGVISIETDLGSAEAGQFSIRVPGRGTFIGVAAADLRSVAGQGADVMVVQYDGEIELITAAVSSRAQGRLRGNLNISRHTAEMTFWFGIGARGLGSAEVHHLVALAPSRAGLQQAAAALAEALQANDWGRVYDVASAELRGDAGRDAFIAEGHAGGGDPVVGVEIERIGEPSTSPQGVSFAVAVLNVLHRSSSVGDHSVVYDAYFILEGSDWKLWFTVER